MAATLLVDFLRGPDLVALAKGRVIVTMLSNHEYQNGPLPPGVLAPRELGDIVDRLQHACDDAVCRDVNKVKHRNVVRSEFNTAFRNVARHLEILANGDIRKLENTGYDIRKPTVKGSKLYGELPAPGLTVKHGKVSGTMIGQLAPLKGAAIYELQLTTGDPTVEENWVRYDLFVHASKMEVKGLTAGVRYWFRARGIGASGNGPWSAPFPLMSL